MATETEMKTIPCPGPPEHEFQIPKGRGRPPRYCSEHDPKKNESGGGKVESPRPRPRPGTNSESKSNGGETQSRPRPRPAPRPAPASEKSKLDEPIEGGERATLNERGKMEKIPKSGTPDTGSRAKAEAAANRAAAVQSDDVIPRGIKGRPMARLEFAASELIPTGQYANVTVGPVRVVTWIDLDRTVADDETYFTRAEADLLVKAANELAEHIEGSVVAVQRDIVLDNLQDGGNGQS